MAELTVKVYWSRKILITRKDLAHSITIRDIQHVLSRRDLDEIITQPLMRLLLVVKGPFSAHVIELIREEKRKTLDQRPQPGLEEHPWNIGSRDGHDDHGYFERTSLQIVGQRCIESITVQPAARSEGACLGEIVMSKQYGSFTKRKMIHDGSIVHRSRAEREFCFSDASLVNPP